jgi:hypothetical protein
MSLMNWFEDKRRFGGLIGALIEKATKTILWSIKKPSIELNMFKSTCLVWLSGQIDQMSKWLIFGLVF